MLAPTNWASLFGEAFFIFEENPRHTGAEHREGDGQQSS